MKYTTVLLDLDGTIFDFLKAEYTAVKQTFINNGVPSDDEFIKRYSEINLMFWEMYERGEITKDDIYMGRFVTLFREKGIKADAKKISDEYLHSLSNYHFTFDGAEKVLSELQKKYKLYAVTNGYAENQYRRVREADIEKYFIKMFVSEEMGCCKPEKQYFDIVFEQIEEKDKSRVLIVGDSPTSDILGGHNAGIDTCRYNPENQSDIIKPTYTVKNYTELLDLLK